MNNSPALDLSRLFSRISGFYDIVNHLLSFNLDRPWRKELARSVRLPQGGLVLDLCTGTGDVALEFAKNKDVKEIIGVDFSQGMLAVAREKIKKKNLEAKISLMPCDVFALPFSDGSFDAVSIAFGLRNLKNYGSGVEVMARMLKPGGYAAILEFCPPRNSLFFKVYKFYLTRILPRVGALFSGSNREYQYLSSSIQGFLDPEDILKIMSSAGLKDLNCKRLSGGIAYLFTGQK